MSIFESLFYGAENAQSEKPGYKDIDFLEGVPLCKDGDFVFCEGNKALKNWIINALSTRRFAYLIYSFDYGSELLELVGKSKSDGTIVSECERYIKECLMINDYITDIFGVSATFLNDTINISFVAKTIYGEMEVSFNV